MAKTQVSITYGEKTLDCELSYTPLQYHSATEYRNSQDCEFTLESVSIVVQAANTQTCFTYTEDITSLIQDADMWEAIEEKSVNTIMERGYV